MRVEDMSDLIERLIGEDRNKLIEQGRQEGRKEERSKILVNMLKSGMSPEDISKYSNIPVPEIRELSAAH